MKVKILLRIWIFSEVYKCAAQISSNGSFILDGQAFIRLGP